MGRASAVEMVRAEAGLQGLQQTTCSCSALYCQKRSASQTAGPRSQLHQCAGGPADPVLFATFYILCQKHLAISSLPETFSARVSLTHSDVNPTFILSAFESCNFIAHKFIYLKSNVVEIIISVTAEALRAKIDRKSAISHQRGHFDPKFLVQGVAPHQ